MARDPPERPLAPSGPGSDLPARVASALVMAAAALGTAWWGGAPYTLFWSAVATAVYVEFRGMTGETGPAAAEWGAVFVVLLVFGLVAGGLFVVAARPALLVLVTVAALWAGSTIVGSIHRREGDWAFAAFAYAAVIAVVPAAVRAGAFLVDGLAMILWLFAVVWGTDIFAYFGGRAIGGPKLWPAISPKKTWAGFVVGTLSGAAAGVALLAVWPWWPAGYRPDLLPWAFLSLVAAVVSQGGDLLESYMKRCVGAKDSGQLIPGHGGVMDRLDGFWAACVVLGLLWTGLFAVMLLRGNAT